MDSSYIERGKVAMRNALNLGLIEQAEPSDVLDIMPITDAGRDMLGLLTVACAKKYGYQATARSLGEYLREARETEALRRLMADLITCPTALILVDLDAANEPAPTEPE